MPLERYSTQHCMERDCIKPWQYMCVTHMGDADEMCGFRGCEQHECFAHDFVGATRIPYIDIVGLLRAAK